MDNRPVGLDRRNPPPEETRRDDADAAMLRRADAEERVAFTRAVGDFCLVALWVIVLVAMLLSP